MKALSGIFLVQGFKLGEYFSRPAAIVMHFILFKMTPSLNHNLDYSRAEQ